MRKKIVLLSLGCIISTAAIAVSVVAANHNWLMDKTKGADPDVYRIDISPEDLMEPLPEGTPGSYSDGSATVKTALENNVSIAYEQIYTNTFSGRYYTRCKRGEGKIYNTSSINYMNSIKIICDHDINLRWGFDVDGLGDPIYVASLENTYPGTYGKTYDFDDAQPNYFCIEITNDGIAEATIEPDIVIKMSGKCATGPNYVDPYETINNLAFAYRGTYYECLRFAPGTSAANKKTVTIPNKINDIPVAKIANGAFYDEDDMESITLPNQLQTIGNSAFTRCSSLQAVEIPNTVTFIDDYAFEETSSLVSLTFQAGGTELLSLGRAVFKECAHTGIFRLPERIGSLDENGYIFYEMENVTEYALNSDNVAGNIVSIDGNGAILATIHHSGQGNKKTLISYPDNSPATSYTIPSDVEMIMSCDGLCDAKNLVTLNISNSVPLRFDAWSATNMDNLEHINIDPAGETVTFYYYSIRYMDKLKDLVIPENVVVENNGLSEICSDSSDPLHIHFVASEHSEYWEGVAGASRYIVPGWSADWCRNDIEYGYVTLDFDYVP